MNTKNAEGILKTTSVFQIRAQEIFRYEGNPYVKGDSIAEHLARCFRIAGYIMPYLIKEFKNPRLEAEIYSSILFHDDDEIVDGFDIVTSKKAHGAKDREEIENLEVALIDLSPTCRRYVITAFSNFRKRRKLASKIAKVIDNLAGNQLVYEQKLGIVAPDSVKFAIWYVNNEKIRGISKTTDALLDAQTEMFLKYRNFAKDNRKEIKQLAMIAKQSKDCDMTAAGLEKIIKRLLSIDIQKYKLNHEDINKPIWEY